MSRPVVPGLPAKWQRLVTVEGDCWTLPPTNGNGYARLWHEGRMQYAHRIVAVAALGPPPFPGAVIDHVGCDNPPCVNPAHLAWSTQVANVLRGRSPMAANARKTHCPQGHEYDRVLRRADGSVKGRECSTCAVESYRRSRDRALARQAERDASVARLLRERAERAA